MSLIEAGVGSCTCVLPAGVKDRIMGETPLERKKTRIRWSWMLESAADDEVSNHIKVYDEYGQNGERTEGL